MVGVCKHCLSKSGYQNGATKENIDKEIGILRRIYVELKLFKQKVKLSNRTNMLITMASTIVNY